MTECTPARLLSRPITPTGMGADMAKHGLVAAGTTQARAMKTLWETESLCEV